jgi:hypothetical protein
MDEGSGHEIAAAPGYGYQGALVNSPSFTDTTPSTHFDNPHALSFDRTNGDFVSVSSTDRMDAVDQLSLAP